MHVGVGTQRVVVVAATVVVLQVAVPTQASAVPHWASGLFSSSLIGRAKRRRTGHSKVDKKRSEGLSQ